MTKLFASGNGVNTMSFNVRYGLNGFGQTSGFTALNANIPTWAKWAASIAGGALGGYYGSVLGEKVVKAFYGKD